MKYGLGNAYLELLIIVPAYHWPTVLNAERLNYFFGNVSSAAPSSEWTGYNISLRDIHDSRWDAFLIGITLQKIIISIVHMSGSHLQLYRLKSGSHWCQQRLCGMKNITVPTQSYRSLFCSLFIFLSNESAISARKAHCFHVISGQPHLPLFPLMVIYRNYINCFQNFVIVFRNLNRAIIII